MNAALTAVELDTLLKSSSPVLLDVRVPEDFQQQHLPGSLNHCVFEVVFGEHVSQAIPDLATPIVVIGWDRSHEADVALEKLRRMGFSHVRKLEGGLEAWQKESLHCQGAGLKSVPASLPYGRMELDLEQSKVEWTGRNLLNKHTGALPLKTGWLVFDTPGKLSGGEVILDLRGITCADLAGSALHDVLVEHLHSDDFFDVEHHPEAVLKITGSELMDPHRGSFNLEIHASLTLRGVTESITFPVVSGLTPDGKPAAQAVLAIDRTRWGVLYGSGKLFRSLAGHLVNDLIEIQASLVTR